MGEFLNAMYLTANNFIEPRVHIGYEKYTKKKFAVDIHF